MTCTFIQLVCGVITSTTKLHTADTTADIESIFTVVI